jgi:hypothetical protein
LRKSVKIISPRVLIPRPRGKTYQIHIVRHVHEEILLFRKCWKVTGRVKNIFNVVLAVVTIVLDKLFVFQEGLSGATIGQLVTPDFRLEQHDNLVPQNKPKEPLLLVPFPIGISEAVRVDWI